MSYMILNTPWEATLEKFSGMWKLWNSWQGTEKHLRISGTKYSRVDQVKFVEDSL